MLALGRTREPQRACLHGMQNPRRGGERGKACMGGLKTWWKFDTKKDETFVKVVQSFFAM